MTVTPQRWFSSSDAMADGGAALFPGPTLARSGPTPSLVKALSRVPRAWVCRELEIATEADRSAGAHLPLLVGDLIDRAAAGVEE